MKKVALIIPYFTISPPPWLLTNFHTCSKQRNVDFIYFTDCDRIVEMAEKYSNIICYKLTFSDYCEMVSERLGVDFHPQQAYKLCDLRPFYGYIHKDLLSEYDFWGYGDNDLVYGDLSTLTSDAMLDTYDVITTMSERIAGHFAIFRNNEKYRKLAFQCNQWKQHLQSEQHVGFDESDWVRLVLPEKRILTAIYKVLFKPFFSYGKWVGMTYRFYSNRWNRKYVKELFTTPVPKIGEIWTYDNVTGKMTSPDGKDLPYLHFLFFKKTKYLKTDNYWKDGFWKIPDDVDISKLSKITFTIEEVKGK